jgi:hypothetical protein
MSNDIACKTTNDEQGADIKAKEIRLCHFLGVAYPNTPESTANKIAR